MEVQNTDEQYVQYGITRKGSSFRTSNTSRGYPPSGNENIGFSSFDKENRSLAKHATKGACPPAKKGRGVNARARARACVGVDVPVSVPLPGHNKNLQELIEVLKTPAGLLMYRQAYRENMAYKVAKYSELQQEAEEDVQKQIVLLNIKVPELKRIANVEGKCDNWSIFESVSDVYHEAKGRAAAFEALKIRAMHRLQERVSDEHSSSPVQSTMEKLRDELVAALLSLTNFPSQSCIVGKAVDVVGSFVKDPRLFRTKLMNFMLLGGAGTGKTTLASVIGDLFAKAGIFVGCKLVEAGRAELVGQYEGQTVAKTRSFLTNNLDNGVILIDEAYAITPWQDGKPEGYGSEAATAMVEFMTRYPGLYCIIVAGYEKQMVRYFLPTNDGLSRRFPNKYVLNDMDTDGLVRVFKKSLLHAQGLPVPVGMDTHISSSDYFTNAAWKYLHNLIDTCTKGGVVYKEEYDQATRRTYRRVGTFTPMWDHMYTIFENQAGSMTNLADEAITVLMCTISFQEVMDAHKKVGNVRPPIAMQPLEVMRTIITQSIMKSSFSNSPLFLAQLQQVESLIL